MTENATDRTVTESTTKKHDFTIGTVSGSIVRLSLPMILAQLVNVLYNIVDRMYLGHMPGDGRLALTGVGVAFPIITIINAFANLCGSGGAPLCSIERGRGDEEKAGQIMGNSLTLLLVFGIVLTAAGYLCKTPLLYLFGASDETIPYANAYMDVYLAGNVFVMLGLGMNPFIESQGFAKTGMLTVVIGAFLNLILDPVFIFVLEMGVQGAAAATILSQLVSAVWVLWFLSGKKAILRLKISLMRLEGGLVRQILALGLSGFTGIRFIRRVTVGYGIGMWAVLMLFPGLIVGFFNGEAALLEVAVVSMRWHFALFFFMAFQYVGQTVFVSLGKAKQAVFFSLFRKAILGVPLILILPHLWDLGITGVLAAEPVTNVVGGLACYFTMMAVVWKKL